MQLGNNTTETSSNLWNAALTIPETSAKSRGRLKKSEIVHFPEFEEAVKYVEDQFWKDILKGCARKKFPRGFTYLDGYLRHRINNISILLPNDSHNLTLTAIYFFQENGKLYSSRDQLIRKRQNEAAILNRLAMESSNWTCVARSKNRRATHVRDYVERKYAHFSPKIRDELYTQINAGFEVKYITKDHVDFQNSQIMNIDGVDGNEKGVLFTRALPNKRLTIVAREDEPKPKCYRHYENWCKKLDDYRKYIISSAKSSHTIQTTNYSSPNDNDDDESDQTESTTGTAL